MEAIRYEKPIRFGEYLIYTGSTHYAPWEFSHKDYDGAPDSGDNRSGGCQSIEECIKEIIELGVGNDSEQNKKLSLCDERGHSMFPVYSLNNFENGGRSSFGLNKCSRCEHEDHWQYDHI